MGMDKKAEKILILNVDRDDDIGRKTSFSTPLIGRDKIIKAAEELLLNDPEDADGNALFGAVKLYDEMRRKGEDVEIAAIAGNEFGGVEADKKLVEELTQVTGEITPKGVILVTDGFSDEDIIPIVGTRIPIISVKRIVVKHSRSVEETYALIERYIKMIWKEQPYRIYFIAIPGLILFTIGLLSLLKLTEVAYIYSLLIIGIAMIIKGFGIDEYIQSLRRAYIYEYIKLATYIGTISAFLIGSYISYLTISGLKEYNMILGKPELIWIYGAKILGYFLPPFLSTIVVTVLIYTLGIILYNILNENYEPIFKYPIIIVAVIFFYFIGNEASNIIVNPEVGFSRIILYFVIGFIILFLTTVITYLLHKIKK
ncbi:hypothetical protein DRN87_00090 [Candidatus Geothermarchaeota archaeon]|nr:MAG: hypothetical protein DRN87_00090 [Candidatus Geothermarchaeota archaeon]